MKRWAVSEFPNFLGKSPERVLGDEGSQSPHNFKSTSFSIPTTCGYCKVCLFLSPDVSSTYDIESRQSSIWGLSKQGKTCRTCGLCVHAKCELKVVLSLCPDAVMLSIVISAGASKLWRSSRYQSGQWRISLESLAYRFSRYEELRPSMNVSD